MRLGDAAALRVVSVVAFLPGAVPSALLATHLGRRQTVALGLLLVMLTYGATAAWVSTPAVYAVVLGVAGLGGALVLVNILPLVFDLGEDTQFGTCCTGLVAVPVQAAAVLPGAQRRRVRRRSDRQPAHALWGRRGGLRDRVAPAAARACRARAEVSDAHGLAVVTSC
jgi:hypothetical protein